LSTALNVTPRRINQLVADGVLPAPKDKGHEVQRAVRAYLDFINTRVASIPWKTAKKRKPLADAALAELKLEVEQGKYCLVEDVKTSAFSCARRTRDAILNLPARLGAIVAAEPDAGKCHDLLMLELRQALEELARGNDGNSADPL